MSLFTIEAHSIFQAFHFRSDAIWLALSSIYSHNIAEEYLQLESLKSTHFVIISNDDRISYSCGCKIMSEILYFRNFFIFFDVFFLLWEIPAMCDVRKIC